MAKQNPKKLTKQFVGKPLPQVEAISADATAVKPEIRQRDQIGNYKQIDSRKADFIKDYGLPIVGGILGGPLGAVYGGLASAILPSNIKQLGSKLLGDARMSDKSLSDEQKVLLWDVIQAAKKRTGTPNGGTEYSDYGTLGLGSSEQYNEWFNRGNIGLVEGVYNTFTNPGFQLGSTVGRGKYFTDPENPDKMYYTDVYDWNPGEKYFSGNKLYQKVRNTLRAGEDQNLNAQKNDDYRMNFTFDAKEIEKLRNKENGGWLDKYDDGGSVNDWTTSATGTAYNKAVRQQPTNIDANAMQALEQVTSYPQRKVTEWITGTNQYPSQAMGITNPYGAFAVDAIADPVNLVGAGLLGKAAKASTKTGVLSKAHKLNPWAFKPAEGMMYRGLGEEGFKDALESGVFRAKQNVEPFMQGNFNLAKSFGTNPYFTPRFATAESYGSKYLAEVPESAANWRQRYKRTDWSQVADRAIPINEGRILQKDWLQGYKPIKENGGWLDKYNDGGPVQENYNDYSVSAPEGFQGDGYSNVGRDYSPAWGGQFEDGGEMPTDKKSQEFYNTLKDYYTSPDRTLVEKAKYAAFNQLNEKHGYAPVRVANRTIMGKRSMINPFTGRLNLVVPEDPEVGEIKPVPEKLIDKYMTEYGHYQQYNQNPEESKLKKSGKFLGHMFTDFGNMLKNTKGFNFTEAYEKNYETPGTIEHEAHNVIQPKLEEELLNLGRQNFKNRYSMAMGGSMPGAVGFTYARVAGAAPKKGPNAKDNIKTPASAEDGDKVKTNIPVPIDEIKKANASAEAFNKQYVQSPNYINLLQKQGYSPDEIKRRQDQVLGMTNDDYTYTNFGPNYVYGDDSGKTKIQYNQQGLGDWPNFEDVADHEWGHVGVYDSGENALKPSEQQLLYSRLNWSGVSKNPDNFAHDIAPQENRADLVQLRKALQDRGIYDSFKGGKFKQKHLNQLRKYKGDKEEYWNRSMRLYKDKDIIKLMNTIAANNPQQGMPMAENGSEMRYFQEGLDFKPKTISRDGSQLVKLDQLTNFTNYNTKQPGGWLDKYND